MGNYGDTAKAGRPEMGCHLDDFQLGPWFSSSFWVETSRTGPCGFTSASSSWKKEAGSIIRGAEDEREGSSITGNVCLCLIPTDENSECSSGISPMSQWYINCCYSCLLFSQVGGLWLHFPKTSMSLEVNQGIIRMRGKATRSPHLHPLLGGLFSWDWSKAIISHSEIWILFLV